MAPITLSARNGQTITFSLYQNNVLVQSGLAMTEIGTLGEFYADMPTGSLAGKYLAVFFDGATKLASAVLWWDGEKESAPMTPANIIQVNAVPVTGTGAEGNEWGPV